MERMDTSKSEEQSPPTDQPQVQSIQTNGDQVLLVKDETAQAFSKKSREKSKVAKKRNPYRLVRAALLMLHRKKSKPIHLEVVPSKGLWRSIVGSMRPLNLPEPAPPAPALTIGNLQEQQPSPLPMSLHSVSSPSSSPFSSACSSIDSMSRYASAQSLQELRRREGYNNDDEEEEFLDGGDEMIDVKAEEFIAKFYEQMRLQRDA
ncbi:uncharacterized protein LOC122056925 [Macadamia integrifolia]|uniref:uncharacterized protein LOC122056925 n=1 Tax=Macadamia integrifolia TaxID=60698 RepID=UPI001C52D929|nr:uncharacterized protein LOC122056925 [Macadamia integrifolia]